MKKATSKPLSQEQKADLAVLERLPDAQIDTSDIPEVVNWPDAQRGLQSPRKRSFDLDKLWPAIPGGYWPSPLEETAKELDGADRIWTKDLDLDLDIHNIHQQDHAYACASSVETEGRSKRSSLYM
ncbi:MAG: hypothetical protein OXQ89_17570 [Rhodospirillaceae bacterium]|nr:hypothetical protein [Rhodospirillaceae bacterium]